MTPKLIVFDMTVGRPPPKAADEEEREYAPALLRV